jgi:hypothetical protein
VLAISTKRQICNEQPTSGPDLLERINAILRTSVIRDGVREAKIHPDAVEFGIFPTVIVLEVCLSKSSSLISAQIIFAE